MNKNLHTLCVRFGAADHGQLAQAAAEMCAALETVLTYGADGTPLSARSLEQVRAALRVAVGVRA